MGISSHAIQMRTDDGVSELSGLLPETWLEEARQARESLSMTCPSSRCGCHCQRWYDLT